MGKAGLLVSGYVTVELFDPRGFLKKSISRPNLVTTLGKELIAEIFEQAVTGNRPSYIGIGTSTTAPVVGQTGLIGTELARVAFSGGFPARVANVVSYKSSFGAGVGTGTVEEAGVFNSDVGGVMLARFLTGTFEKGAGDSLDVTWAITFG